MGLYEDSEFTRQIRNSRILAPVLAPIRKFGTKCLGVQLHRLMLVNEFRSLNQLYELGGFVALQPDVGVAVKKWATLVMTALQSTVFNWSDFDVDTWAAKFAFPQLR